jgi:hypothetical protein
MKGAPMPASSKEKRALQLIVAVGSLVPIAAGAAGVIDGPNFLGASIVDSPGLDDHFRYLSGLLLGIGLAYLSAVGKIEQRKSRFLLLGGIVVLGGVGRLLSLLTRGVPSSAAIGALAMELVVTPLITLWQLRIARAAIGR